MLKISIAIFASTHTDITEPAVGDTKIKGPGTTYDDVSIYRLVS